VAEQHNFVDSRRDPMLNHRLDRGVRCEGEDSRYIVGLSIWRTRVNMTAGKRYKRNWPGKVTSGLSDCSQAIESAQRSMFIAQRAGRPWRRQPRPRWIGRTVPALTSASGWPAERRPLRGLAQESWLRSLGSGRYVGASHGSRCALLLPGRICDMNRRERRTLNIMSVALLGAKLAHRPGDIAA
jgi:hypothetical protein